MFKKSTKILLIIIIILGISLALVINKYFEMKEIAKQNLDGLVNSTEDVWRLNIQMAESQTFYAVIDSINFDNVITVQGLSVNDVNYRGKFNFTIKENTEIKLRYDDIEAQDLKEGDIISVTFNGSILETDPAGISDVSKIQLLVYENNDEIDQEIIENMENMDINKTVNEIIDAENDLETNEQNIDTSFIEENK